MLRKTLAAVTFAAALTLAGCATTTPTIEPKAPAAPPVVEVQGAPTAREVALGVLRDLDHSFNGVPDKVIDDVSESICDAFDAGASFAQVVLVVTGSGLSGEQAGLLVGYAVAVDCPEWASIAD